MGTGIVGIRQHSTTLVLWIQLNSFVSDLDQTKDSLGSWDGLRASLWGNRCYFGISDPWVVDTTDHLLWVGSKWERCEKWCRMMLYAMFFCNNLNGKNIFKQHFSVMYSSTPGQNHNLSSKQQTNTTSTICKWLLQWEAPFPKSQKSKFANPSFVWGLEWSFMFHDSFRPPGPTSCSMHTAVPGSFWLMRQRSNGNWQGDRVQAWYSNDITWIWYHAFCWLKGLRFYFQSDSTCGN